MNAIIAFLHHLAFVVIIVTLSVEMLLLRQPLTLISAKKILRFDAIYGAAAVAVLTFGVLRVMYFEKGADYYMHSAPFIIKMVLFLTVGLISIYPTSAFLKWNKSLKQGLVPEISDAQSHRLRSIIHMELTLLVFVILCAALMAKGIGHLGS
jgi:putative membrane protein